MGKIEELKQIAQKLLNMQWGAFHESRKRCPECHNPFLDMSCPRHSLMREELIELEGKLQSI